MSATKSLTERFWRRVEKTDHCWLWTGYRMPKGYGQINDCRGKLLLVHRLSYVLANGPIHPTDCVLHRCDTPSCVNPDHLFLGSRSDNNADMKAKGRDRKAVGEKASQSRLTEAQVREIHRLSTDGWFQCEIAKKMGISDSQVYQIKAGNSWKHLGLGPVIQTEEAKRRYKERRSEIGREVMEKRWC